jgi:hypothetical protein
LARIPLRVWLISSNVAEESVLYKKLFRKLEEKLNIRAELRFLTWNRAYDTIIDAFKNNVGPDVFSLGTTWVHTLNYLGYIAPVPLTFKVKPCLAEWMKDCIESSGTNYALIQEFVRSLLRIYPVRSYPGTEQGSRAVSGAETHHERA